LRILHVLRAPVGGLFRHVVDLARAQAERGHRVGIVADSSTGAARAEATLAALAQDMALGVRRFAMSRHLGWSDIAATRAVAALAVAERVDVLHGHGAKGGAYARLAGGADAVRVYTPHGGSLHYAPTSPVGLMYLSLERLLLRRTDLLLFESAYAARAFRRRIGEPGARARIVHNGIGADEFIPVAPAGDATDLVFVGELRMLKGVDILLEALARLKAEGRPASATIVGEGPDAAAFRAQAERTGLTDVRFPGAMPARAAFARGKVLVVPSRAESLPYIVLEAAAAAVPIIATDVGGIAEIIAAPGALVPAGDAGALAGAIGATLADLGAAAGRAGRLREEVRAGFSVAHMAEQVLAGYAAARAAR
jgi:glycosyltransferase involved in cell wall biosynthesis